MICHYAERCDLFMIMLNVILLSIVMLNVVNLAMLSVISSNIRLGFKSLLAKVKLST
jgi:hypothetical protein